MRCACLCCRGFAIIDADARAARRCRAHMMFASYMSRDMHDMPYFLCCAAADVMPPEHCAAMRQRRHYVDVYAPLFCCIDY